MIKSNILPTSHPSSFILKLHQPCRSHFMLSRSCVCLRSMLSSMICLAIVMLVSVSFFFIHHFYFAPKVCKCGLKRCCNHKVLIIIKIHAEHILFPNSLHHPRGFWHQTFDSTHAAESRNKMMLPLLSLFYPRLHKPLDDCWVNIFPCRILKMSLKKNKKNKHISPSRGLPCGDSGYNIACAQKPQKNTCTLPLANK